MSSHALASYHPAVQLGYFVPVLLCTMWIQHPVVLLMALVCALLTVLCLGRKNARKTVLCVAVPSAFLVAVLNPLFNHAGMTILCYWPDGNPLTLESILYGGMAGCLFSCVLLWCVYLRYTFSVEGVLYLFGRVSPKMSLLLSMTLRFFPTLAEQWRRLRTAQHGLGKDIDQGSLRQRGKNLLRLLSCLIGLSLENSIQTADSLKSRGYGLTRRTAFSRYRWERRDTLLLSVIVLCSGIIAAVMCFTDRLDFYYFPAVTPLTFQPLDGLTDAAFLALYSLPLVLQGKEVAAWHASRSKI